MTADHWTLIILALTGAVVAWQAWETRKSADASSVSANAARDSILLSHRPRVRIRTVAAPVLETLHVTPIDQLTTTIDGSCHAANVGGTAAVLTGVEGGFIFGGLSMKPPYFDGTPTPEPAGPKKRLESGETVTLRFGPTTIEPLTLHQILRGETVVFFYCLLIYSDEHGRNRTTAALRRFDQSAKRFVATDDADYEYED
jgi:hypothetical protein